MNILLSGFTDWLGKNWIILVLIVFAIALLVPTYIRQKKEVNARNELNSTIKKGTKRKLQHHYQSKITMLELLEYV